MMARASSRQPVTTTRSSRRRRVISSSSIPRSGPSPTKASDASKCAVASSMVKGSFWGLSRAGTTTSGLVGSSPHDAVNTARSIGSGAGAIPLGRTIGRSPRARRSCARPGPTAPTVTPDALTNRAVRGRSPGGRPWHVTRMRRGQRRPMTTSGHAVRRPWPWSTSGETSPTTCPRERHHCAIPVGLDGSGSRWKVTRSGSSVIAASKVGGIARSPPAATCTSSPARLSPSASRLTTPCIPPCPARSRTRRTEDGAEFNSRGPSARCAFHQGRSGRRS